MKEKSINTISNKILLNILKNQDKLKFKILNEIIKKHEPNIQKNNMNQI